MDEKSSRKFRSPVLSSIFLINILIFENFQTPSNANFGHLAVIILSDNLHVF